MHGGVAPPPVEGLKAAGLKPVRGAVFPAAGHGTRFLPASRVVQKELLPVYDRPAIQIVAEEAVRAGLDPIVIVEGPGKSAIEPLFRRSADLEAFVRAKGRDDLLRVLDTPLYAARVVRAVQDAPRGLGHAVLSAREAAGDEPFAVFLPDDVIEPPPGGPSAIEQCLAVREARGGSVVALQRFPRDEISAYGVVAGEEVEPGVWRIRDLVEKPAAADAPSEYAVVGRYVLEPRIFAILAETPPGRGGEVQLTDALRRLAGEAPVWGCVFRGRRYDVGTPTGLLEASIERALRTADGPAVRAYLRRLVESL